MTYTSLVSLLMMFCFTAHGQNKLTPVHLQGVVMPSQKTKLSFVESGLISQIIANGSVVNKGEMIALLDTSKAKIELAKSQAQVRSAASQFESAKHDRDKSARLVNDKVLSDIAMTEAEFSVSVAKENLLIAQAQLELVKQQLANCTISAPYTGAIIVKNFNQGEWVNAGDPIIELVNLEQLSLSIDIPPETRFNLQLGTQTRVYIQDQWVGVATVKTIFPTVEPTSGLLRVVWHIKAIDDHLLSGRYVSLDDWTSTKGL